MALFQPPAGAGNSQGGALPDFLVSHFSLGIVCSSHLKPPREAATRRSPAPEIAENVSLQLQACDCCKIAIPRTGPLALCAPCADTKVSQGRLEALGREVWAALQEAGVSDEGAEMPRIKVMPPFLGAPKKDGRVPIGRVTVKKIRKAYRWKHVFATPKIAAHVPEEVQIQEGLPEIQARGILAHEFGHFIFATQMEGAETLGIDLEEGLCNLLMYQELQRTFESLGEIGGQRGDNDGQTAGNFDHQRKVDANQAQIRGLEMLACPRYGVGFRRTYDAWLRSQLPLPLFLRNTVQGGTLPEVAGTPCVV